MSRDIDDRMKRCWLMSCRLQAELESLDKIFGSRTVQYRQLQHCKGQFRDWRGFEVGELMNLCGLPPEKRGVKVEKGKVVRI